MDRLKPGDPAPGFELKDQFGNTVRLSDFRGSKVLLYFYPKADTPGCTKQAQAVRDALDELDRTDTVAIGMSPDPPERQKKFDDKHGLGFPLLSDADHRIAEKYGVWAEKKSFGKTGMGIVRSAFLIDEEGRVLQAWYKVSPADTVPEVQKALAALSTA
jgi:peroxiredoxin Q/BCP